MYSAQPVLGYGNLRVKTHSGRQYNTPLLISRVSVRSHDTLLGQTEREPT